MITTTGVTSTDTATAASAASAKSLADNFDSFLLLLTKQLQNQDPLEPLDANEFTQQLVQFSGVEQAIRTNTHLEELLATFQSSQTADLVQYIGTQVTYEGAGTTLGVTGEASWEFDLPRTATAATIQVVNAAGTVVHQQTGVGRAGTTEYAWDGRLTDGTRAPEGTYTLKITAVDANGQSMNATIRSSGLVSGLEMANGAATLAIGDQKIDPGTIRAVRTLI